MEPSVMTPPNPNFRKFDLPVKWGLIIGVISCVLATVLNMFLVENFIAYMASLILIFIITVVLFGVAAAQQRKAMGGYITFKEAFQAIFVVILILAVINFIYSLIYMHFIDPDFPERMKQSSLSFTERMGANQEALDQASAKFDEQMKDRQSISKQILGVFISIVVYSIFGFICAAIVKKNKPEHLA